MSREELKVHAETGWQHFSFWGGPVMPLQKISELKNSCVPWRYILRCVYDYDGCHKSIL